MAVTTEIPWGDGTSDKIYLTRNASEGNQNVDVTSDANVGSLSRTKVVSFTTGNIVQQLTVTQEGVPEPYIEFADPLVEQICATNWGDGTGITPTQAAAVSNSQLGMTFRGNTQITSFDEFAYFTGITTIPQGSSTSDTGAFGGCVALKSIVLPSTVTNIGRYSFYGCSSLSSISIPASVTTIGADALRGCSSLTGSFTPPSGMATLSTAFLRGTGYTEFHSLPNLTRITATSAFGGTNFTHFYFAEGLQTIGNYLMNSQGKWLYIDFPSTLTSIGTVAFDRSGTNPVIVCRATVPPSLGVNSWIGTNSGLKIYVPYSSDHSILDAYKAATNWSAKASKMYELNQDGTIPT